MVAVVITREELKYRLSYSEDTGVFVWLNPASSRRKPGDIAGTVTIGYRMIQVNGKIYGAHRLAWLYVYGHMPENDIDHINGNGLDNRLANLREATRKQNLENRGTNRNNTSGHRGVYWDKGTQKWRAVITHFRKTHYIGIYANIEDAVTAVKNARDCHFTHHKTSRSI